MQAGDPRGELRRATQREPGDAMAWIVLSEAELDAGDVAAGEAAALRALALQPGHPEALARLGRAQSMSNRRQEAVASLQAAARNAPRHPGIAVWLGHVLEDVGEAEAAADAYARAHALLPEDAQIAAYLLAWRRRICDWRDLDALSRQVRAAVDAGQAAVEPFAFLSEDASAAEQLRCARLRAADIALSVRTPPRLERESPPHPLFEGALAGIRSPIRIGFLSNGFGAHPTGLLTVALFEALRSQPAMETHLFALNRNDGSPIRQRLQAAAHALHDVALRPHEQVAASIRDAGIDVLFDLRGWGGGGMPEVLAMRPAPVQVNWLAYPGTSGAPWIDYVHRRSLRAAGCVGRAFFRTRRPSAALLPAIGSAPRNPGAAFARSVWAARRRRRLLLLQQQLQAQSGDVRACDVGVARRAGQRAMAAVGARSR